MSANIVEDHLIQKALISKLQTTIVTGTLLVSNILEDQYQGANYTYPSVRVNLQDNTPLGNGVGRTKLSLVTFSIIVESEQASSVEVNRIGSRVYNTLFDSQIKGSNEQNAPNYFILSRIDLLFSGKAVRLDDRLWEKEIFFQSECYHL